MAVQLSGNLFKQAVLLLLLATLILSIPLLAR
jgi:hypothetical protein